METPAPSIPANKAAKAVQGQLQDSEEARWRPLLGLSCELTVDLSVPSFRVSDFLALHPGSVISTDWRLTRDVSLRVNGVQIAWGEFERTGKRLALRLTELA
jgi:flagellar motor switch/type III secretory pathway protein FliN